MSTSNKLTYLNVTKQELKQKINNLGGSIDDNTTFRQYANQLQNVYNNLPKTEYQQGTEINLGKTIKGKLDYEDGKVGIGQSSQDGTPTPSQEIPIECVTGNQDVVVSGKNLFDKNNANAINSYFNNTTPTLSTTSNNYRSYYIECKPNTQYTFSKIQTARFSVGYTTTDVSVGTSVSGVITDNTATSITITTGENAKYLIAFVYHSSYDTSVTIQQILDSIMICEGTDTTYEPYITPTSYQLSLGEYEFAKIGNYVDTIEYDVDEDKVYKNKAIGKVVLNGSEAWVKVGNAFQTVDVVFPSDVALRDDSKFAYSTHYIYAYYSSGISGSIKEGEISWSGTKVMTIGNTTQTLEEFKTWLSTNKPIVLYPLVEVVKEEITGTLKDQVKALYNAHSNNGTTIITSNGDLPLVIKVRGLKGE